MSETPRTGAAPEPVRREIDIEVRYAETDQMGVVHHSNYVVWFEQARTHLCLASGFHYAEIEELGYYLVVTRTETRHLTGALYGDIVRVGAQLDRYTSRGLRFVYDVRRGDDEVLTTGATEHVWVERATRRPCRIPSQVRGSFRRLAGLDG
ncbi:MAG: thioesterase family protein [Acidobacteriota bacterium]